MHGEDIFYGPLAKGLPAVPEGRGDDSSLLWLVGDVGERGTVKGAEVSCEEAGEERTCLFVFLVSGEEIEARQITSGWPPSSLLLYRGSSIDRAALAASEKAEALAGWTRSGQEMTPAWLRDEVWNLVPRHYLGVGLSE